MNVQTQTKPTKPKRIGRKQLPDKKQERVLKDKVKEAPINVPFNNQMFQIRGKTIKGIKYYFMPEVEAAWASVGGTGGFLDNWKRKATIIEMISVREINVVTINGGSKENRGTWGDENAINMFAGYCDERFQLVMSKVFNAVARGDFAEAQDLTAYREERCDSKIYYRELTDAVKECIVVPKLGEVNDYTPKKEKDEYYAKTGKIYGKEADVINEIIGIAAGVRDYVETDILKQVIFLLKAATTFVRAGFPFLKRKEMLEAMYKKHFKLH